MKVRYLVVKMSSVSARVIPDALNLPLQALDAVRLIHNALPECPNSLGESIHLGSQVIESHI